MRISQMLGIGLAVSLVAHLTPAPGAAVSPYIQTFSKPASGDMQIIFHGTGGPFSIQTTTNVGGTWNPVSTAVITELQPGVYMGFIPGGLADMGFYRVVSEADPSQALDGWATVLTASPPANGSYYVPGEAPVVTVRILDNFAGLTRNDFATLNLYMCGPQDPKQTISASKLLNATTNRAAKPHHYIDLKSNPNVQVNGNTLTYQLQPVTDEAPGTYTISLNCVLASDPLQQIMKLTDVQIGTSIVEQQVVTANKCASCHQGSISGKMYLHHIDPSRSPAGSWALDYEPVRTCKACHNNDGYAAIKDTNGVYIVDTIVRRVHGVHMGEELKLDFNTNSVTGDFRDYMHSVFPADIRDCTKCHVDDRWKTQPTRQACGTCHDNVWFSALPAPLGWVAHAGNPQLDDNTCATCHVPDTAANTNQVSIAHSHEIPTPPTNTIDIVMTPPSNGLYYTAGDKPVVSLVFKNDLGVSIGDHTAVTTTNFSTAALFVYGPRSRPVPVLTSLAKLGVETKRASVTCATNGPWAINGKTFRIGINGTTPTNITIVGASANVTAAEFCASLNPVITNLNGGALATVSSSTRVSIATLIRGAQARIEIYSNEVSTVMGWKAKGVVIDPDVFVAGISTAGNDLRPVLNPLDFNDPMVTRTTTNILYQLDDIAGLTPGTYQIYVYYNPVANKLPNIKAKTGLALKTFQVGTSTPEKKIANCTDCHADTIWHLYEGSVHAAPFNADWCTACHDYGHPNAGDMYKNQGGTSVNGWSGFGSMPLSRRIHGVHRGAYVDFPEQIYANATKDTFGHIIFPQDLRNCTKCHNESDTWKQKPSRMACLACHDTVEDQAHGRLMTYIPDANDPYGSSAVELCIICHGPGTDFSADKVHAISNPYVPPYPREKE